MISARPRARLSPEPSPSVPSPASSSMASPSFWSMAMAIRSSPSPPISSQPASALPPSRISCLRENGQGARRLLLALGCLQIPGSTSSVTGRSRDLLTDRTTGPVLARRPRGLHRKSKPVAALLPFRFARRQPIMVSTAGSEPALETSTGAVCTHCYAGLSKPLPWAGPWLSLQVWRPVAPVALMAMWAVAL